MLCCVHVTIAFAIPVNSVTPDNSIADNTWSWRNSAQRSPGIPSRIQSGTRTPPSSSLPACQFLASCTRSVFRCCLSADWPCSPPPPFRVQVAEGPPRLQSCCYTRRCQSRSCYFAHTGHQCPVPWNPDAARAPSFRTPRSPPIPAPRPFSPWC